MYVTNPAIRTLEALQKALDDKQLISVEYHGGKESPPSNGSVRVTLDTNVMANVLVFDGHITKIYPEPPKKIRVDTGVPRNVAIRRTS